MKKVILITLLLIFCLLPNVFAISELEAFNYEGKKVMVGVIYETENSLVSLDIKGELLNVVQGDVITGDSISGILAGYYLVLGITTTKGTIKSVTVPCRWVTYIKEIE